MNEQLLKQAARSSVLLMVLVMILSAVVTSQQGQVGYVMAMDEATAAEQDIASSDTENTRGDAAGLRPQQEAEEKQMAEQLGNCYLMIPKGTAGGGNAVLTENYVYRTVELTVEGIEECNWSENMVLRYCDGTLYTGIPDPAKLEIYMDEYLYLDDEEPAEEGEDEIGAEDIDEESEENSGDIVQAVRITYDSAAKTAKASITLNHLYVPFLYEDNDYYYVALKRPGEVYDKIVVIDAGHGGKHPGTMSLDGVYLEKDFNLSIILKLKELLDTREDIKVYYTRLTDESVYLRPRVNLANEAEADFFISIHNNAYRDRYAYGTEVLYNELQEDQENGSRMLASLCLEEITNKLGTRNRGLQMSSGTYIIGHSEVPVALVEVGYLTNDDDLNMLLQEKNIALAAEGIYNAIVRAFEEKGN